MSIWDSLYRADRIATSFKMNDFQRNSLRFRFISEDEREQKEKDAARLYTLCKQLHAYGESVPQKSIDILARHGYDVSEFED